MGDAADDAERRAEQEREEDRPLVVMEAVCPNCGSADVDLTYSANPLKDGVKCWDCGTTYKLGAETGREVSLDG